MDFIVFHIIVYMNNFAQLEKPVAHLDAPGAVLLGQPGHGPSLSCLLIRKCRI